ncbi:MAG: LLM class flavin-dependent oxidoreductase [Dehalococcoidia bacterium]|nr:LLM class flavin-dependent oxidoreductase [Dehalococcoidia bacterium]MYA54068.1 LLM class flavin-dependent oxidoreductase [Dehalococcoidia bacterium]
MKIGIVIGPWGHSMEETIATMRTTEERGFHSWHMGDHFFSVNQIDSIEPYLLLALAARETERVRIGPFVTPVMFRPPSNVGRLAAQLDLLSGGRFVMGLGAGWHPGEHAAYGVDYPSIGERFDRLDEYIQVMRAMWGEGPASFEGRFYRLQEADVRPKPAPGRPTVLIAGGGEKRTLRLVAKHAHEWNCVDLTPDGYRRKCEILAGYCDEIGRDPGEIRHTMMTMGLIGTTEEALEAEAALQMLRRAPPGPMSAADYLAQQRGRSAVIMGSPDEMVDKIGRLGEAGIDEIVFIWFSLSSTAVPDWLASNVLPQVGDL